MGFEYAAQSKSTDKIRDSLSHNPSIRIVKATANTLDFVWSTHLEGVGWPIDGSLNFAPDRIYLIFHAATGKQRNAFFEELRKSGLNLEFEGL